MTTTTLAARPLVDGRPPDQVWSGAVPGPRPPGQPPLDLGPVGPSTPSVRVTEVTAGWLSAPRPGRPPAGRWAGSLAVALVEVLQGRRASAQLGRWVADDVLAAVALVERRRRRLEGRAGPPAVVRVQSVRVQHPTADAAEVAAHLALGPRAAALAMRLDGVEDRWLCTALAWGPGPWLP
ncbi:MAG: hypothetical protein JWP61_1251 [Friedmanniella sp.]|nr:hypothetical protein [Friedmanniella sp.]